MRVLTAGLAAVYAVILAGCQVVGEKEIFVYMPDGAPAMAFAELMRKDMDGDGVSYRVVSPTLVASKVTNKVEEKNADICALPVTAASKLLGDGARYQMLGTLTNGNLYLLSKDSETLNGLQATAYKDLSVLLGKTVGVMKINDMPGLTFQSILNDYGVAWQVLGNDGEQAADKINLKAISDATAIDPADTQLACYLVAEPAASVQITKNGFQIACSLELLYHKGEIPENCEGVSFTGYPQAVLVAKKSLIDSRKAWLDEFIAQVKNSTEWLYTDAANGEAVTAAIKAHLEDGRHTTTLNSKVLTAECIRRCGVRFTESTACKDGVTAYLQRIMAMQSTGAKAVADEFFYQG